MFPSYRCTIFEELKKHLPFFTCNVRDHPFSGNTKFNAKCMYEYMLITYTYFIISD